MDVDADVVWSVQYISHQFPDVFAVWFVENQGGGAFGLQVHLPICVTYPEIVLLPADPDGVGDRDLVTFASTGSDLQIPVGGEVRWTDYPAPPSPPGPTCVLVDPDESTETRWAAECDVDGDGDLDLVRDDNWSVRWFENQGVAGFAQGAELMSTGYSHRGRFLDLDGDGDPDFLAARAAGSTGELVRRENTGGAVFGGEHVLWTGDPISRLSEPADLDGDGDRDLVAGDHGSAGVWFFERTGSIAFAPPLDLGALHVQQVLVDDGDADGDLDLIVRGAAPTDGLHWIEDLHTTPGALFCSGDGSAGAACPCANASPAGADEGCLYSTGSGARLRTSGSAIVAHGNLVLRVDQARPNQPFMLLQRRNQVALPFKDGILCAGAPTRRILRSTLDADGGADTAGGSVVTEGAISGPGETRTYQAWFRDPQLSVCGKGSNFTNAVSIDWE